MSIGESVCRVLWLSQLSPLLHTDVVSQIWDGARQRSIDLGLTGAMVFDGERFCELLEGDANELATACRDIEFDSRHVGMRMLYAALTPEPRHFAVWHNGYCNADELEVFCGPAKLEGEPAVAAFVALLPRCQLQPEFITVSGDFPGPQSRNAPTGDRHPF